MKTAIVIVLACAGLGFSLSGAVGILRMPDLYCRIQCSSKTITMGALPVLIALIVGEGFLSSYTSRALLTGFLLLLLNPASSHALARAAYKAGVPMWDGAVRDEAAEARRRREHDRDRHGEDRRGEDQRGDAQEG